MVLCIDYFFSPFLNCQRAPYTKETFLKIFLIFADGLSSADPTSDWNAPAEEWGNWVDEEKVASVPQPEEISDVQKVKGDI